MTHNYQQSQVISTIRLYPLHIPFKNPLQNNGFVDFITQI
jgi:hypothetical protein